MDKQTPIVGNLALKPDWDRLSESEPDCSFEFESKTAPSRLLQKGISLFTSSRGEVARFQPLVSEDTGEQSFPVRSPDLFEAVGIVVDEPTTYRVTEVGPSILDLGLGKVEAVISTMYLACSEDEPRLIDHVIAAPFGCRSWSNVSLVKEQCSTSINSLSVSFQLLRTERTHKEADTFDILTNQIRKLHDQFSQWPGSYNQLLLAGSLDYCKSVLTKAKRNHAVLPQAILKSIRSYYADCLGILDQCRDAKATLRRLNLQKIQDKFEIIQDVCSTHGAYPRLAELDLCDIPLE